MSSLQPQLFQCSARAPALGNSCCSTAPGPQHRLGEQYKRTRRGRTYSVSESSVSDTAGTTLSTGVHTGLTQERPRWMTSCTYLGNNRVSEPHRPGAGPPHSAVTTG